jgi:hypothetical protein
MEKNEEPNEKVDMMERKARRLYDMMMEYSKRRRRPIDKKRIDEQINMGFFYTDRTYGMFDDTLLTTALNEEIEDAALALAKNGKKANIGHINAEGNYALLLACKKKYKDVVKELLKHKGNPCSPNSEGETPLLYAVSDVDMIDIVKLLIDKEVCDGSDYKKEMVRILEVGNFEAFKLLVDVPELALENYMNDSKLTLLEYIFISDLGPDYSENHRYAQELLKKIKIGCNPLHINRVHNISALLFAVGDTGSDINACIYNIKEILKYAEEEGNTKYVDFKSPNEGTAFDLIFHNAYADGGSIDIRILKLFIDYYYKNNPNSKFFLRNIPIMCNEPALFEALKILYPANVRELLDNACVDVISARATLTRPRTPTPEIPVGKRSSSKRSSSIKKSSEKLEDAEEIPIVNALTPVSPLPLWAQVDDPHEVGVRMPKPYSPRRGGKKTRKNNK